MEQDEQIREFEKIIKTTDPIALAVAWAQFVDICKMYPLKTVPKLRLVRSNG